MDVKHQLFSACAGGHLTALNKLLDTSQSLVSSTDHNKDTLLHVAASCGHVDIVKSLCSYNNNDQLINKRNNVGETALHQAVKHGHYTTTEFLLEHGSDIDTQNNRGSTALHLACQRRRERIALLLIQFKCRTDLEDLTGDTPIHVACREDLLSVTQALCNAGCNVEHQNRAFLTPLLLAARFSSAEIVRRLLLAGADIDNCTKDGVKAEDIALANGRSDVADLLQKLTATLTSDRIQACISQLLPTKRRLDCVRVNVLGCSGVGKTSLIEALQCGYVRSLLRRSGAAALLSAVTGRPQPTTSNTAASNNYSNAHARSASKPWSWRDSLRQSPCHDRYTRGIDTQQTSVSGAGGVCFFEFSGYEPYLPAYDQLIGDSNCVYVVVVSAKDSAAEQRRQFHFWLDYLSCHVPYFEPIGFAGCKLWAPRVLLVATQSDDGGGVESDPEGLSAELRQRYEADLVIEPHVFVVDSVNTSGSEMTALKRSLASIKHLICQNLPREVGLLQPVLNLLSDWCRVLSAFPVVTWSGFVEYIRSRVNLLATHEHIRELINQLDVIGEVLILKKDDDDEELVVLDPDWFGLDVVGRLFSDEVISSLPHDGRLTTDHLRTVIPASPPHDVARLLAAMYLGAPLHPGLDNELVVPCLDRSDGPSPAVSRPLVNDVQHSTDEPVSSQVYGGFKLRPGHPQQLVSLFPRFVCALCQKTLRLSTSFNRDGSSRESRGTNSTGSRCELRRWSTGLKIHVQQMTATVRLHSTPAHHVTVVCCGPAQLRRRLFYLQENICDTIYTTSERLCPGLYLERAPLSASHLSQGVSTPHAYTPRDVVLAHLAGTTYVLADCVDRPEMLVDLIAFGDSEVFSRLKPGLDLSVNDLPVHARYQLAEVLDPRDHHDEGRDWTTLASSLGLTDLLPRGEDEDSDDVPLSRLDAVLDAWSTETGANIRDLHGQLVKLGRLDAVESLLSLAPLFKYV